MKKLLLSTLSVIALSTASFAQISITAADMSPIPTMAKTAVDTIATPGVLLAGTTGSGQTWDFSSLLATNIDTVIYTHPGWTPYANIFPASNYAIFNISNGDTTFIFAKKSSAKAEIVGLALKDPISGSGQYFFGNVNPAELIYNFPTVLNNSFTNQSSMVVEVSAAQVGQTGFDSARITQTVVKEVIADAEGTMTTPAFTAKPVLRFKINKVTTTNIEIGFSVLGTMTWQPVQNQTTSSRNYQWVADNTGTAIADATIDTTQGNDDITAVTWLYAAPTTSIKEVAANNVNLYPNPATTFVNFKFENNATGKLAIYDVTGKLVNTLTVTGNTITLNTETFANGLYIYKAYDKTGVATYTGKFNVAK